MVSVACFRVRVSVVFIILFVRFGLLSSHLLENSCPLGWAYVLFVYLYFLFISHFGFKTGNWLLTATDPFYFLLLLLNDIEKRVEDRVLIKSSSKFKLGQSPDKHPLQNQTPRYSFTVSHILVNELDLVLQLLFYS